MKKLLCRVLGHKMYEVKPLYFAFHIYNISFKKDVCTRCGKGIGHNFGENINLDEKDILTP
jgi:hypothetical protein